MVDMRLFHHVCDTDMQRKGFLDGYYFYRFVVTVYLCIDSFSQEDEYPHCLNCSRMCKTDVLDPLKVVQQVL